MKKKNLTSTFLLLSFIVMFFVPEVVRAATYELLAPIGSLSGTVTLTSYLEGMVRTIIGIAGILAVIMIVICGVQMIGSPSVPQKEESKKCITNALLGLLLAISAWVILNTINAQLLASNFDLPALPVPAAVAPPAPPAGNYSWSPSGTCSPVTGQIVTTVPPSYCGGTAAPGAVCCGSVASPITPPPVSLFPPAPPLWGNPFLPPSTPPPGSFTPPPPTPPGTPPPAWTPPPGTPPPSSGDAGSPSINISRPFVNGYAVTTGTLNMTYTIVEDLALNTVQILILNAATNATMSTATICSPTSTACNPTGMSLTSPVSFAALPAGNYIVRVRACDEAGNCTLRSRNVSNVTGCTATNPACRTDYNALVWCVGQPVSGSCTRADLNADGVINITDLGLLSGASVFDINRDGVVNPTTLTTNLRDRCYFYTAQDPLLPCALNILGDITITASDKTRFQSMFAASQVGPSSVNIALLNTNLCSQFPCTTPGLGLAGTQHLSVYGEAMYSTLATYDFDGDGLVNWGSGSGDMSYVAACINTPTDPLCARADINRDLYITRSDTHMIVNLIAAWTNNLSQLSDMELAYWDGIFQPEAGILDRCAGADTPLVLLCAAADYDGNGTVGASDRTYLNTSLQFDINGDGLVIYNSTPIVPILITASAPTTPSTTFAIGSRVQAVGNIIPRVAAGNAQTLLGAVLNASQGMVIGGPLFVDGNWWWNVSFDIGTTGWVIEPQITIALTPPPPPPPPPSTGLSTKFHMNEVVGATANLTIRSAPSASGAFVGLIPIETTRGTITGAPVYADGFWWWPVTWLNGLSGWSAENWMKEYTPPPAPSITFPVNNTYASTTIVVVRGTMPSTEVGGTVTVYRGAPAMSVGGGVINTAGLWQVSASYPDGTHTVVAVATDQSLNVGPTSTPRTFTVDTIIPLAPTILQPSAIVTTPNVTLSGTASERGVIYIYNTSTTGALLGTANTSGTSNAWSFTHTNVPNGTHTYALRERDPAGNVGPVATRLVAVATPPPTPQITVPTNGARTNQTTATVSGSGTTPGSTIRLFDNGVQIATTIISASRTWSIIRTGLTDGSHVYTAIETDITNVSSALSASRTLIVDTLAPLPPVVTAPLATVLTATMTITGTASEPSTIRIYATSTSGALLGTVSTSGATNAWSRTLSGLSTGTFTYAITATDLATNISGVTTHVVSVIMPPPAPTITSPVNNFITNATTLVVSGAGTVPGDTINVYSGATLLGSGVVTLGNLWTTTLTLLNAVYNLYAVELSSALQPSLNSPTVSVTIDTIPPALAPTLISPIGGSTIVGAGATFTGTGSQSGNTVWLYVNGVRITSGTIAPSLSWTITGTIAPAGTYLFQVAEQDRAGNEGPLSAGITVTAT